MKINTDSVEAYLMIAAGLGAVYIAWWAYQAGPAAAGSALGSGVTNAAIGLGTGAGQAVVGAVQGVGASIYSAGNDAIAAANGEPAGSFSFGSWFWEFTHPNQVDAERSMLGNTPPVVNTAAYSGATGGW